MKKKKTLGLLLVLVLVVTALAGCSSSEQDREEGYRVYYVNATGLKLEEISYEPSAQNFEEMMDELMGALAEAPAGYTSALAGNVRYQGYERGIDALRVDFSQDYYELSNIEAVLLQAAVVKTLCQVSGVTKIMLTVDGEQAKDSEGQPVAAMDADDFIETKEGGINSYLYAMLSLYFADSDGQTLVRENRNLHYSSNMVLERVVVEQLIQGPESSGLKALFTKNVKIQNLYIQDGICTINFDEEANKTPSENSPSPELVLQAVVNSICETDDDIKGVKFEIAGDSDVLFRDKVSLNQVFEAEQTAEAETEA